MMLGRSPACAGVVIGSGPTSKMEKKASNKKGFLFMLMITSVREGGSLSPRLLGICFWRKGREERNWVELMGKKGSRFHRFCD